MSYLTYAEINSLDEFSMIAGGFFTLSFSVYEADGVTPRNIGGSTVKWVLSPYGQTSTVSLQKTGTITGTSTFTVTLNSTDTQALSGKYIQQPVITAFDGKVYRPAQGIVLILPRIPIT